MCEEKSESDCERRGSPVWAEIEVLWSRCCPPDVATAICPPIWEMTTINRRKQGCMDTRRPKRATRPHTAALKRSTSCPRFKGRIARDIINSNRIFKSYSDRMFSMQSTPN